MLPEDLIYDRFKNDYLKPFIETDYKNYPFPHSNVSDIKLAAQYQDRREEDKLFKLFALIKKLHYENSTEGNKYYNEIYRKKLIQKYYVSLDRKYNDQTVDPVMPRPEKVGLSIDRIVANGVHQIGLWACGFDNRIYPWMVAGTSTVPATYGDQMANVTELARVNCITDNGFLDPMVDGWNASGGFVRGTPSGLVSEIAMADTSNYTTSKIFDRSVLPINDRIDHEQNEGSFTLSAFYVVTSI